MDGWVVGRTLVVASGLTFLVGMLVAAVPFYAGKPVDLKRAVLSNLASPGINPRGHLIADSAVLLCGLMLVPVAVWLCRCFCEFHRGMSRSGTALLLAGLAGVLAIGASGPYVNGFSLVHIYLAYATFIFAALGMLVLLGLATRWELRRSSGRGLLAMSVVKGAVVVFLLWLLAGQWRDTGQHFFDCSTLLRSLAFCEWVICAECFVCLWVLAQAAARMQSAVYLVAAERPYASTSTTMWLRRSGR